MQLRVYIEKPAKDHLETLSRIETAAGRVGAVSGGTVVPYWKIDSVEEVVWDIVLIQEPDAALRALLQELGTGWRQDPDGASLDCRHGGRSLPGITSVFIDIEYLDWGRLHGILPRLESHQRVRIVDGGGLGSVCGHAFDRDSLSWSYGVLLDSDERVHVFPEDTLEPVDI